MASTMAVALLVLMVGPMMTSSRHRAGADGGVRLTRRTTFLLIMLCIMLCFGVAFLQIPVLSMMVCSVNGSRLASV